MGESLNLYEDLEDPILAGGRWIFPDGTTLPVVSGGDGSDDDEDEDDETDDEDEEDDEEDDDEDRQKSKKSKILKMSQDRLSKITTREHKRGEREGRKAVLKALGFSTLDEAKSALNPDDEDQDKGNKPGSQDDKAKREVEEAKREAEEAKKSAQIERRLLRTEGFNVKRLDHAVRLLDVKELLEADDDEIDDAIESLREEIPELWDSGDGDEEDDPSKKSRRKPSARKSNPGSPPRKRQATMQDAVQSRLSKRHGAKLQKQ